MNALTQQQINQYQWQVADGVARIVNPYSSPVNIHPDPKSKYWSFLEIISANVMQTNAPDGIYSGEAFELEYQIQNRYQKNWFKDTEAANHAKGRFKRRSFLRLKPSHLPAVLTTQPGEEWKDRYREVKQARVKTIGGKWADISDDRLFSSSNIEIRKVWHLNTPPAEQETKSLEHLPTAVELLSRYYKKEYWGNCDVFDYYDEDTVSEMVSVALSFSSQLQSALTQKDQRIAELERENKEMREHLNEIKSHGIIRPWI